MDIKATDFHPLYSNLWSCYLLPPDPPIFSSLDQTTPSSFNLFSQVRFYKPLNTLVGVSGLSISFTSFLKDVAQCWTQHLSWEVPSTMNLPPSPWLSHHCGYTHGCHCGHPVCAYSKVSSASWSITVCFNTSPFDLLALCTCLSLVPFVDSGKPLQFFIAVLNFNPGPQYARNPPGLVWWANFISILYSIIRVTNENIKQKQAPDRPWVTPLKMNFQFDGEPW